MPVRYRVTGGHNAGEWRSGESLNFSSEGLLFTSAGALAPGRIFEVLIDWPARLENRIGLRLAVRGRIVRSTGNQAAIRFEHHEFRLRNDIAIRSVMAAGRGTSEWRPSAAHS